jgi:alpha-beta hydrolase superfamily lysophospholipase
MSDLPGPATPTRTLTIPSRGETLHAEWFAPHGAARGVAVIVHGYAEHIGRYREVANVLSRDGWGVLGYDVRGHGKSTGRRGHVEDFADYLDELDVVRRRARELADEAKLPARDVIVAHSHGSLIALRALADRSRAVAVDAAVVSSPFLGLRLAVSPARKVLARVASRVAPGFAQANRLRVEDLTSDPEKQRERTADTLCHAVATARWFTEAMAAQEFVAANIANVKVPTLWLVGGDDPIADPARSRALGEKLAGADYHHLGGLRHEVFNELARKGVYEILVSYLRDPKPKALSA